jgi:hypothetical protein
LVSEKVAVSALTLAVTVNVPAIPLAVSVGAVALPLAFVRIGIGGVALNVPPAPVVPEVTLKLTATPARGIKFASVTVTCSGAGNSVPHGVLWLLPDVVRFTGTSPLCVTVTCWPITVIWATRLANKVFAWKAKAITPLAVLVIVSQAWSLVADRGMLAPNSTVTESVPAWEPRFRLGGKPR